MKRGVLSLPNTMSNNNHYRNHHELADRLLVGSAVFLGRTPAEASCMCCGRVPERELHQIYVQATGEVEYFQIGHGRCEQILVAALRVRAMATGDSSTRERLQWYQHHLNQVPRIAEIQIMGDLLLPSLTNPDDVARLTAYMNRSRAA